MPRPALPIQARFDAKIIPGPNDCWHWSAAHFKKTGYALFTVRCADGKWRPTVAHRIAYELYRAEIPPGLELDHLCRNRGCVNPWHLEPVTRKVNMARGMLPTAILVRENRCAAGHEFTEANTITRPNGKRECRTCARTRDNARSGTRQEHYRKMYRQRKARQLATEGVVCPCGSC